MNLTRAHQSQVADIFQRCLADAPNREAAESIATAARLLASVFASAGTGAGFRITDWFLRCGLTCAGELPE